MDTFLEAIERIDEINIDEKLKPIFIDSMKKFSAYFAEHPEITVDIKKLFEEKLYSNLKIIHGEANKAVGFEDGRYEEKSNKIYCPRLDVRLFVHEFTHFIVHNNPNGKDLPPWADEMMTELTARTLCNVQRGGYGGYPNLIASTEFLDKYMEPRNIAEFLNGNFKDYLKRNGLEYIPFTNYGIELYDDSPIIKAIFQKKINEIIQDEEILHLHMDTMLDLLAELTEINDEIPELPEDIWGDAIKDIVFSSQIYKMFSNVKGTDLYSELDVKKLTELTNLYCIAKHFRKFQIEPVFFAENKATGAKYVFHDKYGLSTCLGYYYKDDGRKTHTNTTGIEDAIVHGVVDTEKLKSMGFEVQKINTEQLLKAAEIEYDIIMKEYKSTVRYYKQKMINADFCDINSEDGKYCFEIAKYIANCCSIQPFLLIGTVEDQDKMLKCMKQTKHTEEEKQAIGELSTRFEIPAGKLYHEDYLKAEIENHIKQRHIKPGTMLQITIAGGKTYKQTPIITIMTDEDGFKVNPNLALIWNDSNFDGCYKKRIINHFGEQIRAEHKEKQKKNIPVATM